MAQAAWRLLSLALLVTLALTALWQTGDRTREAVADECITGGEEGGGEDTGTLLFTFREGSAGGPLTSFRGFSVTITPDPLIFSHTGSRTAEDNGLNDDDNDFPVLGSITIDDACQTDHVGFPGNYTFVATILPGSAAATQGCRLPASTISASFAGPAGVLREIAFVVFCLTPPPTPGAATAGAPAGSSQTGSAAAPIVCVTPATTARPVASLVPVIGDVVATGAQVVPAVAGAGSAYARFELSEGRLFYVIAISGVSPSVVTAAQLHVAPPAANGPVVRSLPLSDGPSLEGSIALSDAEVAELTAGNFYLNLTSEANPEGFARGQLPVTLTVGPPVAAAPVCLPQPAAAPGATVGGLRPPSTGDGGLR